MNRRIDLIFFKLKICIFKIFKNKNKNNNKYPLLRSMKCGFHYYDGTWQDIHVVI
jgi:hypothetical protein